MTSPFCMSWKFANAMPHSWPDCTSRTSSLKRFKVESSPSWITTLSRMRRTFAPRFDDAFGDAAAGDLADLRDVEHFEDFRVAEELLARFGRQHAGQRRLHVIDDVVDDVVVADVDAVALGPLARLLIGADIEADDGARPRHAPGSRRIR